MYRIAAALLLVVALAGVLVWTTVTHAGTVTNGDFSVGLTGWTNNTGFVSNGGGYALFAENPSFGVTGLSQQIAIPTGAKSLTFDYNLSSTADATNSSSHVDEFSVFLVDPGSYSPLLATLASTTFFDEDRTGAQTFDSSIVSVLGNAGHP